MSNDAIKYVHIRPKQAVYHCGTLSFSPTPRGGVTAAYVLLPEEGQQWEVQFAVAECSDKDNYCRATGRAIATGRLASIKHSKSFFISDSLGGAAITGAVIEHALDSLPRWSRVEEADDELLIDLDKTTFAAFKVGSNGNPL